MLVITRTIELHEGAPADLAPATESVTRTTSSPDAMFVGIYRETHAFALGTGMPIWIDARFYPDPDSGAVVRAGDRTDRQKPPFGTGSRNSRRLQPRLQRTRLAPAASWRSFRHQIRHLRRRIPHHRRRGGLVVPAILDPPTRPER